MSNLKNRKNTGSSFCYLFFFLQFFEPNKIYFLFHRLQKERAKEREREERRDGLVPLIFTFSSLLIFCFINRTFHLFLSLTASFVYFIRFFFRLLTGPSEHKAGGGLSLEDIHHPSTQIFNKTSAASATQSLLSSYASCALPCCA